MAGAGMGILFSTAALLFTSLACGDTDPQSPKEGADQPKAAAETSIVFPKIDRHPAAFAWKNEPSLMAPLIAGKKAFIPKYNPKSQNPFQVDLRERDLSTLDLRDSLKDLLYATFDNHTVWPADERMPKEFDRQRILELGKNPGLGVRGLHLRGITGRGVGLAIIDQPLLVDHQEYKDRLRLYEEIHVKPDADASMHGPAVASIAVGKTIGVAPEADLYYIGSWTGDRGDNREIHVQLPLLCRSCPADPGNQPPTACRPKDPGDRHADRLE